MKTLISILLALAIIWLTCVVLEKTATTTLGFISLIKDLTKETSSSMPDMPKKINIPS